ncbi:ABC1 kinase family protein [Thaumasiovibrio subtropicus]|uniref:ABC1 kinase family protein n=1 Tax=Thaumasiovibrio subtropicus TaxID=1891207 RepID=UPI000B362D58|nr:AarF/ABC1/UbiB kinase family protein [Thaumasiovibrio subtropicus]
MKKDSAVPQSRLQRIGKLGRLAGRIAGNVLADGAKELSRGRKPQLSDLLLTPKNASQVAQKLSQMRGAAMKVGQLLSMDGGDLLPAELSQCMAILREGANPMAHGQLVGVMEREWGAHWLETLSGFDLRPFAAASIGQVHKGYREDGQALAVKVQYPGVRESIDSDVDNVIALLRATGLLPKGVDLQPLIEEAKQQLHAETDYLREADMLHQYQQCVTGLAGFLLPEVEQALTTENVLAMTYVEGDPIESLEMADQAIRNSVVTRLYQLLFKELFEFHFMQTDPNFANYRYATASDKIVLLDFGASRAFSYQVVDGYRRLLIAGQSGNRAGMLAALRQIGFLSAPVSARQQALILDVFEIACEPLRIDGDFNFADHDLVQRMKALGEHISHDEWHSPPVDAMFIHRKIGGMYLLAARLKAQVNLKAIADVHLIGPKRKAS